MNRTFSRVPAFLALATVAGVLGLAVLVLFFAHPMADDLRRAAVPSGQVIGYVRDIYMGWTGRWAGVGFSTMVISRVDPTRAYWALLLGVQALSLACLHAFLTVLFGEHLSRRRVAGLSLVAAALFWTGMPSPGWTVYWWTGAVEYHLPIAFSLLLIAALLGFSEPRRRAQRILLYASCGTLALLTAAMHELYGLMLVLVLATGSVVSYRVGNVHTKRWAVALVAAGLGFLTVFLAPGNEFRGATITYAHDPIRTIRVAEALVRNRGIPWVTDAKLLMLTFLFIHHPQLRSFRPAWIDWKGIPWKLVFPSVGVACLAIGFVAPSWALGRNMPLRVLNANYAVFLIAWFATVFVWTRVEADGKNCSTEVGRAMTAAAFVVLSLGLGWNDNVRAAVHDLRSRFHPWGQSMNLRYDMAREAVSREERVLVVPVAPPKPELQPNPGLSTDPQMYQNHHFSLFFGLDSVRVEGTANSGSENP